MTRRTIPMCRSATPIQNTARMQVCCASPAPNRQTYFTVSRELSAPSTSLGTCCKVGTMYSPLRLAVAVALPLQSPTSTSCGLRPIETQT
ncbi:unnamed protein product [Symbiodinium sp. CCMP2592]|nr:unnamed protein product [Symbiodinium sp. CCMP2592]